MSNFDDTRGKMGDTSGDTSGKIGDTSGRSTADVRRVILNRRSDDRVTCLENKIDRLEQDIFDVTAHFDDRIQGVATLIDKKAGEADLATLQKAVVDEIRKQIAAALAPIEERLRRLERPPS